LQAAIAREVPEPLGSKQLTTTTTTTDSVADESGCS
jgi:hypothetical protein